MRWFTDKAYAADDAEWDEMLAEYSSHVIRLADQLPPDLAALATDAAPRMSAMKRSLPISDSRPR